MKKFICIISALILSTTVFVGCKNKVSESSEISESSVITQNSQKQEPSSGDVSIQQESIIESSAEYSEESIEVSLPEGITRTSGGSKLKYTNSVLSLSVTFPSEFCILNNDYKPIYGIYLQNTDGTATLLMESVEDTTTTASDLADVLKEKYPDTEIYITDYRDVVCKRTYTDRAGNEVMSFLKVKPKTGGYNEILLTCSLDEKDKFEAVFNQINFS